MVEKVKRLVLHIGSHKAGSTAVQDFCRDDGKVLPEAKIYYPTGVFEQFPHQHSYITRLLWANELDKLKAAFETIATAAHQRGAETVFMSGEDICTLSEKFIIQLATICESFFETREYVLVLRKRDEFHLSQFKHNLAYGQMMTEVRYIDKFKFSPRNSQNIWKAHFSKNAHVILYDEIKDNFLSVFFKTIFGVAVTSNIYSNVSHDMLMLLVINAFLKDNMADEIRRIIWNTSQKYKQKIEFPIESLLLEDIKAAVPDSDWIIPELDNPNALLHRTAKNPGAQDPVAICEKMIFFFTELRKYFEQAAAGQDQESGKNSGGGAKS